MNTATPAPAGTTDLTNCDREPIHQLGRVQGYGALIAVSADWIVQHASENLNEILGITHDAALGRPLSELIVSDGFERIRRNLRALETHDGALRLFGVVLRASGRSFDVSVHHSGAHLIIEFEPKREIRESDLMAEVYPQIAALRRDRDLRTLALDAAKGLQTLCGFDSVMVYEFQRDHSGKVIAETRLDGTSRYDGLHFPATDIPVQARALYKRALLRLIADVDDPGAPITPGVRLDGQPLDLSLAVTRSVSPIHIEYLRNMGVKASMSVSIMKDGELWGLFACHHDSPRYIDYERRTAIEMFAHMFAYEISRHEDRARKQIEADTGRLQSLLMGHMAEGESITASLLSVSKEIAGVLPHDGMILLQDEDFHATGSTPTEEEFASLARMLDRSIGSEIFCTDNLGAIHPEARAFTERSAGMLVIPISRHPRDYLVLTRREVDKTRTWAGDPNKPAEYGPNGTKLTPRNSFEAWQETVRGRSTPWLPTQVHAAELLRTTLLEIFLKVTDAANLQRKRAQEQQSLLISELNHRVRNILNLMRGLVSQSRATARTLEEFTSNLDGRIHALARAHDQLTSERWEPASLKALIACEFEAYADSKSSRVAVMGPDAMVQPNAYTTLALVLHEMATNSVKYGALCDQSGSVTVTLATDRSGGMMIDWVERGGPPVQPPTRRGFGSTIIETSIPHELRGDAEISYNLTGVQAHFRLPPNTIAKIVPEAEEGAEATSAPSAEPAEGFTFSGPALVLEDSLIIAMDAASILEDMGAPSVKIASSVDEALEWLAENSVDFALLDVNLRDEQSVPVAELLAQCGTPFVLATGYGMTPDLQEAYPPCTTVQKPFSAESIRAAADALAKEAKGG